MAEQSAVREECPACGKRILVNRTTGVLRRHRYLDTRLTCQGSGRGGGHPCQDCDTVWWYEWFMVYDHVWRMAGGPDKGFLCVGCLENRLMRRLWTADFIHWPINMVREWRPGYGWGYKTDRLVNRLTRISPDSPLEYDDDMCQCGHARKQHLFEDGTSLICDGDGCDSMRCEWFMLADEGGADYAEAGRVDGEGESRGQG